MYSRLGEACKAFSEIFAPLLVFHLNVSSVLVVTFGRTLYRIQERAPSGRAR